MKKQLFVMIIIAAICGGIGCTKTKKAESKKLIKELVYTVEYKASILSESDTAEIKLFIKKIIDDAINDKIKVYSDYGANRTLLTGKQIKDENTRRDTITSKDPDDPSKVIKRISVEGLNPNDVTKIAYFEEWYYDEKTYTIEKKIKAIAPTIDAFVFDPTTQEKVVKGSKALFWVVYE
ncbi:MAG: hypothetical protein PHD97_11330 [Bacteroidales bacterium]|nr:hypothetical protein [Bacteroidales bacterium]